MSEVTFRKFLVPEIIFGNGSRKMVGKNSKNLGAKKVFIVTDKPVRKKEWFLEILESLTENEIDYIIFDNITPNPRAYEIMEGVDYYKINKCDVIIGIGGGSPMDAAKGVGISVANNDNILEFEGIDKIRMPIPPLILIPSTAGTASEISQFAIISDINNRKKIAIVSKAIVPDLAIIDPEITMTMDLSLTAFTGMDALVHAIEAFVSRANSPITDIHALESIKLINENLPRIIKDPNNLELREKVMLGSMEAGMAFSNAILGAVHAMSHSLGGYLDLAHGECNSMLLEHIVLFNFKYAEDKFLKIMDVLGINYKGLRENEREKAIFDYIVQFKKNLGIKETLGKKGVKSGDIPFLAKNAKQDPCLLTNPRSAQLRDIEVLYEEAL